MVCEKWILIVDSLQLAVSFFTPICLKRWQTIWKTRKGMFQVDKFLHDISYELPHH